MGILKRIDECMRETGVVDSRQSLPRSEKNIEIINAKLCMIEL